MRFQTELGGEDWIGCARRKLEYSDFFGGVKVVREVKFWGGDMLHFLYSINIIYPILFNYQYKYPIRYCNVNPTASTIINVCKVLIKLY